MGNALINKKGIGNTSFVFAKIRKFWLDPLLLFPLFTAPNAPTSFMLLLIHLAIVNVAIISVFANLLKNYFKALYCRDKRSITKTDKLSRKLFEVMYLNDIPYRSRKRDFRNRLNSIILISRSCRICCYLLLLVLCRSSYPKWMHKYCVLKNFS